MALNFDAQVDFPASEQTAWEPHDPQEGVEQPVFLQSSGALGPRPSVEQEKLAKGVLVGPGDEQGQGFVPGSHPVHPQSQVRDTGETGSIEEAESVFDSFQGSLSSPADLGTLLTGVDTMVRQWVDLAQPHPGVEVPPGLEGLWDRMTRAGGLYQQIEARLSEILEQIPQEDSAGLARFQADLGKTLYGLQKYEKSAHEGGIWAPDFSPWEVMLTRADDRLQSILQGMVRDLPQSEAPTEVLQELRVTHRITKGYPQRFMKMRSPKVARHAAATAKELLRTTLRAS